MNAHTIIAPVDWEVTTECHHEYTADDCHSGIVVTDALTGRQKFIGELGRFHLKATVLLDVPYCSSCDKPVDAGICRNCNLIHADLVPLTTVTGDPFESASDWLLRAGQIAKQLNAESKRDVNNGD